MMRHKNDIIIGSSYRLDAKKMANGEANGICMGDCKLDIQTLTKQKRLSETVAAGPKDALTDSLTTASMSRVTWGPRERYSPRES